MDPEPLQGTDNTQSPQDLPAPGTAKESQREPRLGTQTRGAPVVSRKRLRSGEDPSASCVCVVSGLWILQVPLQKPPPLFIILFFHSQRFLFPALGTREFQGTLLDPVIPQPHGKGRDCFHTQEDHTGRVRIARKGSVGSSGCSETSPCSKIELGVERIPQGRAGMDLE